MYVQIDPLTFSRASCLGSPFIPGLGQVRSHENGNIYSDQKNGRQAPAGCRGSMMNIRNAMMARILRFGDEFGEREDGEDVEAD